MKKRILALLLGVVMVCTLLTGCSSGNTETDADPTPTTAAATPTTAPTDAPTEPDAEVEEPAEPVVIRYGTHWLNDLDPYHVDDVTGEYTMAEANRQAALAALDAIKEQLNVEFEFIQYSGDTRNDLMTSVLAGNPICDLAVIWGGAEGTILAQNVLQQLDIYSDMFADEESSWMFYDKLYGHNYLLTNTIRYKQRWPLCFNITMIEQVDALKDENGNTIYPMDLFLEGNWTWSTFTEYLTAIQAHYANVTAPDSCVFDTVQAYETDHRFAGLSAMYAAGGAIYGIDGLMVDTDESISGVQYIEQLMSLGLLTDPDVYDDGYTPQWTTASSDFSAGGTVFTDSPDWWIGGNASSCAERNESIGIVPWPRPDSLAFDSEQYNQVITLGDSVGVLKGVDEETTELALEAYKVYWQTYYMALGGTQSVTEYREQSALTEMASLGLDIYNENYGDKLIECFTYLGGHLANDYADLLDLRVRWDDIMGKSLYGIDGMSSYDVAVKANISDFTNVISNMESILSTDEIRDNQAPSVSGTNAIVPLGTDVAAIDWSQFYTATDSVDGELDMTTATYQVEEALDTNTVGEYDRAVRAAITDASGNEASARIKVIVFNPDNTNPPVIEAAAELPTVALDTDASTIAWGDFLASATDSDGLDISGSVTADLSQLDVTTPGTYEVVLTVSDYAGNMNTITLAVTVAAAE